MVHYPPLFFSRFFFMLLVFVALCSGRVSADPVYEFIELAQTFEQTRPKINNSGRGVAKRFTFSPLQGMQEEFQDFSANNFVSFEGLVGVNQEGVGVGFGTYRAGGPGSGGCISQRSPLAVGFSPPDTGMIAFNDINEGRQIAGVCGGECISIQGRRSNACSFINGVKDVLVFDHTDSFDDAAFAINNLNWVVGRASRTVDDVVRKRAFLKIPGIAMRDLGTLGGAESVAYDINEKRVIVGSADTMDGSRAFLYDAGGAETLVSLGTLGGNSSVALGINESNIIVGESVDSEGQRRAFLYSSADGMIDLNTMLDRPLSGGVILQSASGINEMGEIVGVARFGENDFRSFLLRPVKRPALARSDFTGNKTGDFAVWRPSSGTWFIRDGSLDGTTVSQQWGLPGDWPMKGDFNGDRKIDYAVWRPGNGTWYICPSENNNQCESPVVQQFGLPVDRPVVGDFDGDGKDDLALYRGLYEIPETRIEGTWYILRSSDMTARSYQFGLKDDFPVPGDFNGDGRTDLAVWRPSNGTWYVRYAVDADNPATSWFQLSLSRQWGLAGDRPVAGDFDGDGIADLAVWRPSNGTWYVCPSRQGFDCSKVIALQFGLPGDIPVAGALDGDNLHNFTVWRPQLGDTVGTWFSRNPVTGRIKVVQWGLPADLPLTR
jgi:probable HAF family extracellular repeat protein